MDRNASSTHSSGSGDEEQFLLGQLVEVIGADDEVIHILPVEDTDRLVVMMRLGRVSAICMSGYAPCGARTITITDITADITVAVADVLKKASSGGKNNGNNDDDDDNGGGGK